MPGRIDRSQFRVVVGAAAVSAVLSVLATLLAIGYFRQKELQSATQKESVRANEAAARARDAANRGMRARDQAEELIGFILEDLRDELDQLGRSDLLLAAAAKAVAYFDNLPPELVTSDSQAEHASVLLMLSDARYQQGDHAGAIAAARRTIELWKRLAAAGDPEGERTVKLGRALAELAHYQNQSGDHYAARDTFTEVLRLYEDPNTRIKDAGWREHGRAKAHLGLGEVQRLKKNYEDARSEYSESVKHITTALERLPEQLTWLQLLMTVQNNIGVVFMHEKNYVAAAESFLRAVEPNRTLIRLEPKNRRWEKELATTLLNVGATLHLRKEHERAEPFLREALALRKGLADWDRMNTRSIRKLAHAWHRMATFEFDTGRNTNALASARSALAALRRLLTIEPDDDTAIGEVQEYAGKYQVRLTKAGMTNDALQLIQETTAFAETSRSGQPASGAWDKLLASLREASADLGSSQE